MGGQDDEQDEEELAAEKDEFYAKIAALKLNVNKCMIYSWNQMIFENEDPRELFFNIKDILTMLGDNEYESADIQISDKDYSYMVTIKVKELHTGVVSTLVAKVEVLEFFGNNNLHLVNISKQKIGDPNDFTQFVKNFAASLKTYNYR